MNKPCVLKINENIYYVYEHLLMSVPYFKKMYSGNFTEHLDEVDYKTLREYNFEINIFCEDGCELLVELLNFNGRYFEYDEGNGDGNDNGNSDGNNYEKYQPYDSVIQLVRISDFLGIDYEVMDSHYRFHIHGYIFNILLYPPTVNLNEYVDYTSSEISSYYDTINLTNEERRLFIKILIDFELKAKDNLELIFPGYNKRLQNMKDLVSKYFEIDITDFYEDTVYTILTGDDDENNIIYCSISNDVIAKFADGIKRIRCIFIGTRKYVAFYYDDYIFVNIYGHLSCSEDILHCIDNILDVFDRCYKYKDYFKNIIYHEIQELEGIDNIHYIIRHKMRFFIEELQEELDADPKMGGGCDENIGNFGYIDLDF